MWFKSMKPTGIDKVSPFNELREDFSRSPGSFIGAILAAFAIGDFVSGMLVQLWRWLFNTRKKIGIINALTYGISDGFVMTVIFSLIALYGFFRLYRATRKNYVRNYDDNYLISEKETYGGAHFQTKEELEENFEIYDSIDETDGEVFGTDDDGKIYVFGYPSGLNRNRYFVGAPGSGKSAAIIKTAMYQNMKRGISMVCTDSKGDLYKETSSVARQMGYNVKALMLRPKWFKNSDGFNLFSTLHADDEELDSIADVYANIIIKNTSSEQESESYWGKNEFNLAKTIIMYVATDPIYVKSGRNNLPEVYKFLTSYGPKEMAGIFRNIPEYSPIRQCYDIFANCSEQNQGQIINGLAIRLSKLSNIYLQHVLSSDDMDFTLPMKEKCIYYVVISDTDDSYKFVSSLFFSGIFNSMCEYSDNLTKAEKKEQIPVDFLCDEYANTGGILGLPKKIATVRSRKMSLMLILQDNGQFETMYSKSETSTILNCCVVKGLISTNDENTAKYFSDLTGPQTVLVENQRYSETVTDIIHAHDTIQKTMGEGNRNLMLYSELMNGKLKRDEILYIISGMPPVKLKMYFSEKMGELIHPYEQLAQELGEYPCNSHMPEWRKIFDAQKQADETAMQGYSQTSSDVNESDKLYSWEQDITADIFKKTDKKQKSKTSAAKAGTPAIAFEEDEEDVEDPFCTL